MRRRIRVLLLLLAIALAALVYCGSTPSIAEPHIGDTPTQEPAASESSATPTSSPTATDTPAATPTATAPPPTPTATATPYPSPTATPSPTPIPTPDPRELILRLSREPELRAAVCQPDPEQPYNEGQIIVPMLLYHFVGRESLEDEGGSVSRFNVTLEDFETQLALLHHLGYQTVTVNEVIEALHGERRLPERPIAITVDDGWIEQYTHIFPLLLEYNMRATFYIPSSYPIGGRFVTWEHLADMVASGMEIGSHTKNHLDLTTLSEAAAWEELSASRQILEARLGITVTSISYPFGAYNNALVELAKQAGYRGALALGPSPRQHMQRIYALTRAEVAGDRPMTTFVSYLPWRGLETDLCREPAGME